jgi:hypothetical protein
MVGDSRDRLPAFEGHLFPGIEQIKNTRGSPYGFMPTGRTIIACEMD